MPRSPAPASRPLAEPKKPKPVTPAYLERAALHYLERYASSAENLRRVLRRKVKRRSPDEPAPAETEAWIAAVIAKLESLTLLNDAAYAEGRVRRLYAQGKALGRIRQTLKAKGVTEDDARHALARLEAESPAPVSDLPAAVAYARKRKIGPFRADPAERAENRQKDLGALARRGFAPDIARRVVRAESIDALEAMLHERES